MRIALVVAAARNRVIGVAGRLPWHLPDDLARFRRLTIGHTIVMGRRTFDSIGRALPGRTNLVLTHRANLAAPGATIAGNFADACAMARAAGETDLFVVGGAAVYALALPLADRIELTRIDATPEGDVLLPEIDPAEWREAHSEHHAVDARHVHAFDFVTLERRARRIAHGSSESGAGES